MHSPLNSKNLKSTRVESISCSALIKLVRGSKNTNANLRNFTNTLQIGYLNHVLIIEQIAELMVNELTD